MNTSKLMGGMFGFDISMNGTKPPFMNRKCSFYLNARSAILAVINCLRPKMVWMPSYLCLSMLDSPKIANTPVKFFPVNKYLQIEENGWISDIMEGDVTIVIDYFGFKMPEWVYKEIKERGAWIIEDACQALLSLHVGKYSDFIVYSPRKFVGVPDAGILWCNNESLVSIEKIKPPSSWWFKAFAACLLRREFDNSQSDGDQIWFRLFKEMEFEMPVGNYEASSLSITLLELATDWESISRKRRENYMILLKELRDFAIYRDLPDDVVPLGFPISVNNRNKLQQKMFNANIYPAIHWHLTDIVPEQFLESHKLSQNIMTLMCDQRYDKKDIERIINIVKEEFD